MLKGEEKNEVSFGCRDAKYAIPFCDGFDRGFEEETCIWNLQRDGNLGELWSSSEFLC
jgi:hypothetical protein